MSSLTHRTARKSLAGLFTTDSLRSAQLALFYGPLSGSVEVGGLEVECGNAAPDDSSSVGSGGSEESPLCEFGALLNAVIQFLVETPHLGIEFQ